MHAREFVLEKKNKQTKCHQSEKTLHTEKVHGHFNGHFYRQERAGYTFPCFFRVIL